jgi:hypothetical protein
MFRNPMCDIGFLRCADHMFALDAEGPQGLDGGDIRSASSMRCPETGSDDREVLLLMSPGSSEDTPPD